MYFVRDNIEVCGFYECKDEIEKMDSLLSLAITGGDYNWI